MKKTILILTFFTSVLAFGQIPVTDVSTGAQLTALNANTTMGNSTLASQLSTAGNQLTQMEKSYEQLKKSAEKIEKVSNVVKSINNMEDIISLQKQAISNVKAIIKNSKVNKNTIDNLNSTLVSISANVNIINKLLTNGLFNMTDKERTDFFDGKRQMILIDVVKTRIMKLKYQ